MAVVPESPLGETTWWLFESCVGIGSVKMGIPGLSAQILFLAPIAVMRRIIAEKSVEKLPLMPYSAMCANGIVWTCYGLLMGNPAIWVANIPAAMLGASYMAIFLRYCPAQADWLPSTRGPHIVGLIGVVSLVGGIALSLEAEAAATMVGSVGVLMTVAMFTGPLAAMRNVILERSTRSLPLPMTIATVVNCALWTFYGTFMLQDSLIWLPNVLGFFSGVVQLALFARFGIAR